MQNNSFNNSEKPKLCFVARFIGHRSEVWLWRQITGLVEFEPHVVTWGLVNTADYPLDGITVHQLPFEPAPENGTLPNRLLYRLRNVPSVNFYGTIGKEKSVIRQKLKESKPNVILCHFGQTALRILPAAKELNIPLVAHFHGIDISSSLQNKWYRWSLVRHVKQFAAIIVVGIHQKNWFLEQGVPESRIHVIPCGVPTDMFEPPLARPGGVVQFVTVSRLNKQKGLDCTIKAFNETLKKVPNTHLNIVGDGEELNNLKGLVRYLNISDHVTFFGSCPPESVKQHLTKSHVFLQHSTIREGSPVSIAEAAAMELPIIATRCGGIVDQVVEGRTGYLVDQKDVGGMAIAMIKLAKDDELRSAMGRAGRTRMIEYFDTQKQIAKLESVLLSCCQE